jgi:hypothetical protein
MPEHIREQLDEFKGKLNQEAQDRLFKKYFFPDEKLFSVIIPTMGMADEEFTNMLQRYDACDFVGEILIIDNTGSGYLNNIALHKTRVIYSGKNIFVNPAWNLGVSQAKYENIILANDDLLLDDITGLLAFISENLDYDMVLGLNPDQNGPYRISGGDFIGKGWGRFIAIKKGSYRPIMDDLKVWYGDNLLTMRNVANSISGVKGIIGGSASCERPEIRPIIENDAVIYPVAITQYMKPKICHIIMSCNRPEYLDKTLQSLENIDFGDYEVYRILVDDFPDGRDEKWFMQMAQAYNVDRLILNGENKGLSKVWSDLWDMIKDMDFDYVLHQEDDVIVNEKFSLKTWLSILEQKEKVCSAVLTRQKWYPREEETQAMDTDIVINNYRIEYRNKVFSPMMSLYRHSLTREGIREKAGYNLNEGMIMHHLRNRGQKCAYIKTSQGKNMVTHIGDWFHGKRVLPGEPGYETFVQYDPNKFYCSKTGAPKIK